MNIFVRDDTWQRGMRDKILAPYFYGKYAFDGRYVFIDKGRLAARLQREAIDTVLQGRHGAAVGLEEKIVRFPKPPREEPYDAFALETMSCTVPGREKTGWMAYGTADYLLYCFSDKDQNSLKCCLVDFPELQAWFNPQVDRWPRTVTEQINRTECRVVPIRDVDTAIGCRVFWAESPLNRFMREQGLA